jgi:two-component system CheB/CheR fusion protein
VAGDEASAGDFPIVGIGASAGGLAAFEAFFKGMPAGADLGMAFVLVQHLAPDHASLLADLIQRCTRMRVFEVVDGLIVQPNCVYIIPPNRDLALRAGTLHLSEPGAPRGQRLPIDHFFGSLAQDRGCRAICIVLAGNGGDGNLGVRAVKAAGGLAMVQNPGSTEYDAMPRSALATGQVDYVLPPAEMPGQLLAYVANALGRPPVPGTPPPSRSERALEQLFDLLFALTGHDFSQYKPNIIHRRLEDRMALSRTRTIDEYLHFIAHAPLEVEALHRDLLIGITHFFRDPAAFQSLQEQIPSRLRVDRQPGSSLRVWVPGCSTGEEAFSIAILLQELLDRQRQSLPVQIFATDIDPQAIAMARSGRFPASLAKAVSPERLARWFTPEQEAHGFRIVKGIREMLIFSQQDLLRDPPFSKLDLISCRNLLIYLNATLQKKLIPLFHYALNPGGLLFLGSAESIGGFGDLFSVLDRRGRLYLRKADGADTRQPGLGRPLPSMAATARPRRQPTGDVALLQRLPQWEDPQAWDDDLRTTDEDLKSANEELKSSNDEMQLGNDALQVANEELETSKEELQAVNEELATVNAELQAKVTDLSRLNNDMNNLLAGTGIATLFVDTQLQLMRFTPAATRIINLIPSDIGRPIGHIVLNLVDYPSLMPDAQAVLDTLLPRTREIRGTDDSWYRLRIQPYRTIDNGIEGAVMTFVDITELKAAQEALLQAVGRGPEPSKSGSPRSAAGCPQGSAGKDRPLPCEG